MRSQRGDLQTRVKRLEEALEQLTGDDGESMLLEELADARAGAERLRIRLGKTERELGVGARQKLEGLKGNEYLRHRMNAAALKSRVRSKLVAQKFERARLERAYHHQVMRMFYTCFD